MINLLPIEDKREIRAGRANRLLVRYVVLTGIVTVGLLLIFGFVWLYLRSTESTAKDKITDSENSSRELARTVRDINSFQSNLASAKQILDKQINYSGIILRYAATIPDGAIIDTITLSPEIVGAPTSFIARVKNESSAVQLKNSLNKSPYFSNVYFEELQRNSEGKYDYTVTMKLTTEKELLK